MINETTSRCSDRPDDSERSLARRQVVMGDAGPSFPLFPPMVEGCAGDGISQPLELEFDYDKVDPDMFLAPAAKPGRGLEAWAPLMPPLSKRTNLAEGNTPMPEVAGLGAWAGTETEIYVKDESRNPTWSHKDRLNRCTISAAVLSDAPGVIVASSGNHGASASAYAAAAGLPCIVLASATAPRAMQAFVAAYGGAALAVPAQHRWSLMAKLREVTGFHPVSNLTPDAHTGHAFAIEGYKSISFEIYRDLGGRAPGSVFVPTGYAECLYGIWKGFHELKLLGLIAEVPVMFACEPSAYGVLHRAMRDGLPAARVDTPNHPTRALSIATPVGGLRGRRAMEMSNGHALALDDDEIDAASTALAHRGIWVEFSAAAGMAGLRRAAADGLLPGGPAVVLTTAPGLKDVDAPGALLPEVDGTFGNACEVLRKSYGMAL